MNEVRIVDKLPAIPGGYIFNNHDFQSLKSGRRIYLVLEDDTSVKARICFHIKDGIAFSGYRATFGSFDFINGIDKGDIIFFLKEIKALLAKESISEIVINHWPLAYPNGELVQKVLLDSGFRKSVSEFNQQLNVTRVDFIDQIRKNERKKLKQAYHAGFNFSKLDVESLSQVYSLVKDTRERKGFPVSMSYNDLEETFTALPDHYHLFGVFDDQLLIAASVSIRISEKILYNFYHADHKDYRPRSPLVMLNEGIYSYCRTSGIEILDLGISSVDGVLNQGLYTFKENLGCTVSEKNTYVLNYESN